MSEWIEHDGESVPQFKHMDRVVVRFRSAGTSPPIYWLSDKLSEKGRSQWVHGDQPSAGDIIAYKVVSP
jgi:hypothetical protein